MTNPGTATPHRTTLADLEAENHPRWACGCPHEHPLDKLTPDHRKLVLEAGAKALVDKMDAGLTAALHELGSGNALVIARFALDVAVLFHAKMLRRVGSVIGTQALLSMVLRGEHSAGVRLPAPVDITLESVRKLFAVANPGGTTEIIELEARPGETPS